MAEANRIGCVSAAKASDQEIIMMVEESERASLSSVSRTNNKIINQALDWRGIPDSRYVRATGQDDFLEWPEELRAEISERKRGITHIKYTLFY